jgi:hypothetical protein
MQRDDDDYEDDPRTTMKDVDFQRAFFTQSNWTGSVLRESWYGKHAIWQRILFFSVLSSWAWTLSTIVSLVAWNVVGSNNDDDPFRIPLLMATTERELNVIKQSHAECLASLCVEIGRGVDVDCIINDNGKTGRVEYGDNVPVEIFFPQICHDATEATFGYPYLNGDARLGMKPIAFITVPRETNIPRNETARTQNSLLTLLPDCSVTVNTVMGLSPDELGLMKDKLNAGDWEKLYQEFKDTSDSIDLSLSLDLLTFTGKKQQQYTPGHRETHILKYLLCPNDMAPEIQNQLLPQLESIYNHVMDYRIELTTGILFLYHAINSKLTLCWLMLRTLLPAMLMQRYLSWPHRSIRFWDIWRTLLLLCVISSYGTSSVVLTLVMVLGALCYKDTTAAMEWAFLGILAWTANDTIYPYLDAWVGDSLANVMGIKIALALVHAVVVGEGWWKIVTLYVVYKSYQGLQLIKQRPDPLEQTRLHLDNNNNHQHQQHPLIIVGQDHIKVD